MGLKGGQVSAPHIPHLYQNLWVSVVKEGTEDGKELSGLSVGAHCPQHCPVTEGREAWSCLSFRVLPVVVADERVLLVSLNTVSNCRCEFPMSLEEEGEIELKSSWVSVVF